MKWQLRFCDKKGSGSFSYVEADTMEEAKPLAVKKANEELEKELQRIGLFRQFQPFKTVWVWEYDFEKRDKKRGGLRFMLRLSYLKIKHRDGGIENQYWYETESD